MATSSVVGFTSVSARAATPTVAYKLSVVAGHPGTTPGGPATASDISPSAVATDGAGNTFFIDARTDRVEKVAADGTISIVAGAGIPSQPDMNTPMTPQAGPALNSAMNPSALAIDSTGNLYISDYLGYVEKVTPDGTLSILAGRGRPPGSSYPTAGPGRDSVIQPGALTVDGTGNVFVVVSQGYIVKITADGTLSYFAGNGNVERGPFPQPTPGPATASSVSSDAITTDAAGNVFAAGGGWAEKITPTGTLSIIAGGLNPSSKPFPCPATSYPIQADAIAVDSSGDVFLSEGLRVFKVTPDGTMDIFAGYDGLYIGRDHFPPKPGPATNSPMIAVALDTDASGNLIIGDEGLGGPSGTTTSGYIEKVTPDGTLSVLGGDARPATTPGPATLTRINPGGVVTDTAGNIYTPITGHIAKITPDGTLSFVAGNGTVGPPVEGPALQSPLGVGDLAIDASGNLYATDRDGYVIRISTSGLLSIVAGDGQTGTPTSGPATSTDMTPTGVAVDTAGDLYIAAGEVLKVTPDGQLTIPYPDTTIGSTYVSRQASRVAVDPNGGVYFVEGGSVFKLASDGSTTVVAGGGYGDPTVSGPATPRSMNAMDIAFDASGNLLIADGNVSTPGHVDEVAPNGTLSVIAGQGDEVTPTTGWGSQAALSPYSVAAGPLGAVIVSDGSSYVAKLTPVAATAPSSPSNVVARAGDPGGAATVTFAPSRDTGGVVVSSYTVSDGAGHTCSPSLSMSLNRLNLYTRGPLSCVVTGLTPGQPTTFTVTATNAAGTSAPSSASNAVTPYTVPDAPTGIAVKTRIPANVGGQAVVSWTAPVQDGWASIYQYTVSVTDTATPGSVRTRACTVARPTPDTAPPTTCTVSSLMIGHTYTFAVAGQNAAGTGTFGTSDPAYEADVPEVPYIPTSWTDGAIAKNGGAQLRWFIEGGNGYPITSYTITAARPDGGPVPAPSTVSPSAIANSSTPGTEAVFDLGGLTNGVTYTFTVTATNQVGTSAISNTTIPVTPQPPPPPVPVAVTRVAISGSHPYSMGSRRYYPIRVYLKTSGVPSGYVYLRVSGIPGFAKTYKVPANNGSGVVVQIALTGKTGTLHISASYSGSQGFAAAPPYSFDPTIIH